MEKKDILGALEDVWIGLESGTDHKQALHLAYMLICSHWSATEKALFGLTCFAIGVISLALYLKLDGVL